MTEGFPRKFGKYHLLAPLAQGGMGALYLAVTGTEELEKLVVIKTVLPHLADAEYVQRFRDEAKVVVKLSHGNLVPVFDAGQVSGEIFLAMEYIEGKDLRAVWNRCAKKAVAFPVDVAVHIVKELCRGLAYAHGFGSLKLVHRDVSPPNVLISFHGEVKLTDFGLASSTLKMEKTAPGVIYGKVSYMSPEQARGEPLDGRTDLYAAGIILWELLTGRQLFPPGQQQPHDLLNRAKDPHPDPPSKRASRVPKALDEIVLKALTSDPEKRYQSGEEMRVALAGWLAAEAPGTDSARLEQFVRQLFAEDIEKEHAERQSLVQKARTALTDRAESPAPASGKKGGTAARSIALEPTQNQARKPDGRPRAVPVPAPGPSGATVVQTGRSDSGAAATAAQLDDSQPQSAGVIGQVIDGRYHVRNLIGEGGMGRVYEAEHIEIGKRVALKILHPAYSRTPEVVARFRREARAASKIGHPNIVDVTDSGTTADGSVYFVMEFLEGLELADVIDREGALDIGRTLNIGTQICRALAAAHNAGIVHRDLKPENVFLVVREGTTDFVKVLDFGIAKSAELEERKERLTHPGMAMGTPEYMAPEQAAGKPADPRSDIYAVGAILYEMLTGAPPYDGENFMEILTKKATLEPRPLRELRPEVNELVEKVVMRALAREPTERPQSMEGFEYELTKCLAGRGVAVAKMLGMPVDPMVAAVADPSTMAASGPIYDSGVRMNPLFSTTASRQNPLLQAGALAKSGPAPEVAPTPMFEVAQPSGVGSGPAEKSMGPGAGAAPLSTGLSGSMPSLRESSAVPAILGFLALVLVMGGAAWWYTTQPPLGTYYRTDNASSLAPAESEAPAEPRSPTAPVEDRGRQPEAPADKAAPPARPDRPVEKVDKTPAEKPGETRPIEKGDAALLASNAPPASKKDADTLLAVAATHEAQRRHVVARALYDRVNRGRFDREKALMGLGRIAFENKEFPAAVDFAKRAFDAGAGDAALILLGDSQFRSGNYDEAIRHYQAYLKRHKTNRLVRQKLTEAQKAAARKKRGG